MHWKLIEYNQIINAIIVMIQKLGEPDPTIFESASVFWSWFLPRSCYHFVSLHLCNYSPLISFAFANFVIINLGRSLWLSSFWHSDLKFQISVNSLVHTSVLPLQLSTIQFSELPLTFGLFCLCDPWQFLNLECRLILGESVFVLKTNFNFNLVKSVSFSKWTSPLSLCTFATFCIHLISQNSANCFIG